MAFIDERLPEEVEKGSSGGPSFNTMVATLASGHEKRNINWSQTRAAYDIGYGVQSKEHFNAALSHFYVCNGRAHSFRFKDWGDYEIGIDPEDGSDDWQEIATGDGSTATFQIVKVYEVGSYSYEREITKPVSGTVRVRVNNVEKTITTQFTVNLLTGIITFTGGNIPANGHSIEVICEFDVPVRFDTDRCDVTLETWKAGAILSLPVVEVRVD